ncbi:MAG TPA: flagellar basal body P-ring protein FlgI [Terriglobales bacterium]|jgi:flagellar P-ring protein precursor FlgI
MRMNDRNSNWKQYGRYFAGVALFLLIIASALTSLAAAKPDATNPNPANAPKPVATSVAPAQTANAVPVAPSAPPPDAQENSRVLIRDIASIEGIRNNPLIGYGIVIGLKGTGDRQQTVFTTQTLANVLQRLGLQIPAAAIQVRNVASVIVTAELPAFARPGTTVDVTVSSVGDAKSLEGGILLLTALHGVDGQVYGQAQGPLTLGGYSAGSNGNLKEVNHSTVGRVPEGGIVEKDASVDINRFSTLSFILRNPDFTAARDVAAVINADLKKSAAVALDSRRIDVSVAQSGVSSVPDLISEVQNLSINFHPPAKVIINERTGTIVMGGDVKLSPVAVIHGDLTVEVITKFAVSQPGPFSRTGDTKVIKDTDVTASEAPAKNIQLREGADVEELINGLHTMGATAHDVVAILQAIKSAGGLQAELEIQ